MKSEIPIILFGRKYWNNLINFDFLADFGLISEEDLKIFNDADGVAEYSKCVEISTQAALREMVLPGLMAITVPVIIGFVGVLEMLGGLLAGVTHVEF